MEVSKVLKGSCFKPLTLERRKIFYKKAVSLQYSIFSFKIQMVLKLMVYLLKLFDIYSSYRENSYNKEILQYEFKLKITSFQKNFEMCKIINIISRKKSS